MKKVLLLGALLSTMAFGALTGTGESTPVEITLSGTALKQLEVEAGQSSIAFGQVVANTTAESDAITITVKGTTGGKAKLTAEITGTKKNTLKVQFDDAGYTAESAAKEGLMVTESGVTTKLKVSYTPQNENDSLTTETIKLTAIYTE